MYADLKAHPVAVCKATILVLGSVPPRRRKEMTPCSNEVSYASLPNSTFIIDPEDSCSEPCLMGEEVPLASAPETTSLSTVDSDEKELEQLELEQLEQVASVTVGAFSSPVGRVTAETTLRSLQILLKRAQQLDPRQSVYRASLPLLLQFPPSTLLASLPLPPPHQFLGILQSP